jgi:hypothetical protein
LNINNSSGISIGESDLLITKGRQIKGTNDMRLTSNDNGALYLNNDKQTGGHVRINTNSPNSNVIIESGQLVMAASGSSVYLSKTGATFNSAAVKFSGSTVTFSGGTVSFTDSCSVSGLTPSDYRLKSNVRDIDELTTLNLRPVQFDMHDKHRIGLIAHEVQEIIPCVVNGVKDGKEYQSVEYIDLISVLIKDIQRLNKKIIDNDAKSESRLSQLENSTTR